MDKIPISRFSLMTRLTQKALRLYDKKKLLIPQEKNELTGYRYYNINQVELGLKIKSLSLLGFNIDEIKRFLIAEKNNDTDLIEHILSQRLKEVRKEKKRLADIELFLLRNKQEALEMIHKEPTIKEIPDIRVLSIRKIGSFEHTIGDLIGKICATLQLPENTKAVTVTGPIMSLCYDEEYKENDADIECAIPISGKVTMPDDLMDVKTYPGGKVLSYLHKGSYQKLYETYVYLYKYAEEKGIKLTVPNRELYFNDPAKVAEEDLQTEIQIPIQE